MEFSMGIKFNDFVLLTADTTISQSIVVLKTGQDKMFKLSDKLLMSVVGESGDAVQFAEYIEKNIQLYKMRNGYELSPHAAASFTRKTLADYLRSRTPYNVNLLIAGFDDDVGPELFYIDYLASIVKTKYAAHGYGGFFTLSTLDMHYRPDMTEAEAVEMLKKVFGEIKHRFIANLDNFITRVIDKDGVRIVKTAA